MMHQRVQGEREGAVTLPPCSDLVSKCKVNTLFVRKGLEMKQACCLTLVRVMQKWSKSHSGIM